MVTQSNLNSNLTLESELCETLLLHGSSPPDRLRSLMSSCNETIIWWLWKLWLVRSAINVGKDYGPLEFDCQLSHYIWIIQSLLAYLIWTVDRGRKSRSPIRCVKGCGSSIGEIYAAWSFASHITLIVILDSNLLLSADSSVSITWLFIGSSSSVECILNLWIFTR